MKAYWLKFLKIYINPYNSVAGIGRQMTPRDGLSTAICSGKRLEGAGGEKRG